MPPTAVATTGKPAAMASMTASGIPSKREGSTKRSAAPSRSGTSSRWPRNVTLGRDAERVRLGADRGFERPRANQPEAHAGKSRLHDGPRIDQRGMVLLRGEPGGDDDDAVAVVAAQAGADLATGDQGTPLRQPVLNDDELAGIEIGREGGRRGVRNADDAVDQGQTRRVGAALRGVGDHVGKMFCPHDRADPCGAARCGEAVPFPADAGVNMQQIEVAA